MVWNPLLPFPGVGEAAIAQTSLNASITIIVALGISIPTSITVVQTNTSISLF